MATVKKMYTRVQSQIFTWAGDEALQIGYDGMHFLVPPFNETAKAGGSSPYRFESVRDAKGELVPGTLLVKDEIVRNNDGSSRRVLSVTDFCDYLTRERDELFGRGFNIVSNVQDVAEALEAGRPLYLAAQDARARAILSSEMARRKKYEDKGEPAPPRDDEHNVIWAIQHLRGRAAQRPKVKAEDIRSALDGEYQPTEVAKLATKRVSSAQEIYQEAAELGVNLTKTEMQGLLENDEEQTAYVLEKIKLKKETAAAPA